MSFHPIAHGSTNEALDTLPLALVSIFEIVNPPGMIAVDIQYDHPVPVQFIIIIRLDQDIIHSFRRCK